MGDQAWQAEPVFADSEEAKLALFLASALPVQGPECQLGPPSMLRILTMKRGQLNADQIDTLGENA